MLQSPLWLAQTKGCQPCLVFLLCFCRGAATIMLSTPKTSVINEPQKIMAVVGLYSMTGTATWPQLSPAMTVLNNKRLARITLDLPIGKLEKMYIIKVSLGRKHPSCGRLSWPAFSPWCQPHHHASVNHIIIKQLGRVTVRTPREFRFVMTLGPETLRFSGKMVSVVAEVGSLFLRFRASICKSCRRKVHRTVSRVRLKC